MNQLISWLGSAWSVLISLLQSLSSTTLTVAAVHFGSHPFVLLDLTPVCSITFTFLFSFISFFWVARLARLLHFSRSPLIFIFHFYPGPYWSSLQFSLGPAL